MYLERSYFLIIIETTQKGKIFALVWHFFVLCLSASCIKNWVIQCSLCANMRGYNEVFLPLTIKTEVNCLHLIEKEHGDVYINLK